MGQTLTHGVYLPDEGERNCYNGLAANWQLLDTSVGTIAEHTSALSGKAPLVHTHSKSDITDFPVYGNAAGTICEGNDSRLSDARTPVAHTHTKSDVTDLLNSNFIPSANNSYDLGSSSNQWKSVYAQSYYYNGTAWGLNKANEWTQTQTFLTNPVIQHNNFEKGVAPSTITSRYIQFTDKNNAQVSSLMARINPDGESYVALRAENLYKNGAMDPTGNTVYSILYIGMTKAGVPYCVPRANLYPDIDNAYNLGTSTNKWKTLNGINPGALSLPSGGTTENTDWYNVAGSILPTGGNATDFTGGQNFFTPSKDGWLCLVVKNCSYISVWDGSSKMGQSLDAPDTTRNQQIILPVLANHSLEIRVIGSSWYTARLFMPKGNV